MTARACGRCAGSLDADDLRCALCGLAVPAAREAPAVGAARIEVVRCRECGAAMRYDPRAQGAACAFCGSVTRPERVDDPMEQAADALPFLVDPARARAVLGQWLSRRGFFAPADLASQATIDQLRPLWWPAWIFSAAVDVWWTADSDAGARRSAWAPHAGTCALRCENILVAASRGLSSEECARLAPGYELARAAPADVTLAERSADAVVEQFDVQRSAARRRVLDAVSAVATAEVTTRHVPGSRARHVRVSPLLRALTTRRFALPAYVLAYRYRGRLYRAVVHGHDERVVLGRSPVSVWRVLGVVAAALLALAIVVAVLSQVGGGA